MGGVHPDKAHVGAVDHDVLGGDVVELEDVLDHVPLAGLDGALFLADIHHVADLLLGDFLFLILGADVHQAQNAVGGLGEQPDDGLADLGHAADKAADHARDLLGLLHRHALGHEFAEHQRKIGNNHGDDDDRQRVDGRSGDGGDAHRVDEIIGDAIGEVVRAEGRAEKTGQGDGDLYGRKERGRRFGYLQHQRRALVARVRLAPELVFIQGDEGDLRRRENGVDGDEDELQQYLTRDWAQGRFPLLVSYG